MCGCIFFFFKQKTAYEMRISDWSSDVCSSDLIILRPAVIDPKVKVQPVGERIVEAADESVIFDRRDQEVAQILALGKAAVAPVTRGAASRDAAIGILADKGRPEEHTSELQSLMHIPYAGLCLKRKKDRENDGADVINTENIVRI